MSSVKSQLLAVALALCAVSVLLEGRLQEKAVESNRRRDLTRLLLYFFAEAHGHHLDLDREPVTDCRSIVVLSKYLKSPAWLESVGISEIEATRITAMSKNVTDGFGNPIRIFQDDLQSLYFVSAGDDGHFETLDDIPILYDVANEKDFKKWPRIERRTQTRIKKLRGTGNDLKE